MKPGENNGVLGAESCVNVNRALHDEPHVSESM
jgi:hypothetical protein